MISEYLDKKLIADWRFKLRHLWTIRIALFWIVISAIVSVWGALIDTLPTWTYVTLGFAMNISLGIARLLKQPGVDE